MMSIGSVITGAVCGLYGINPIDPTPFTTDFAWFMALVHRCSRFTLPEFPGCGFGLSGAGIEVPSAGRSRQLHPSIHMRHRAA